FGGVTGDDIGVGGEVAGSGGEGEGGGRSGLSLPVGVCAAGGDRKQAGGGCGAAGVEGGREVDNGVGAAERSAGGAGGEGRGQHGADGGDGGTRGGQACDAGG